MNWQTVLNIVLGVYGAILTTYTIYTQRKDKETNIKVSLSIGFLTGGRGVVDTCLFIKAANHGNHSATLSSWQIVLPHKKQLIYPNANAQAPLPHILASKRNYQAWIPVKVLAEALVKHGYKNKIKIKGVYFDETDNKYFSKSFEFDTPGWLKD